MAKRILIFGIGNLGQTVAKKLLFIHEFELELIDRNPENLEIFRKENIPLHVLDLKNKENMRNLEIKDNDICVVLIGEDIASSVLTCQNLIDFKVKNIFARSINSQHQRILSSLGITNFINPDEISASEIINKISRNSDFYKINNRYGIIFITNSKIKERKIKDLALQTKHKAKIILIKRFSDLLGSKEENIIPDQNTKIKKADDLVVLTPKENAQKITNIFRN